MSTLYRLDKSFGPSGSFAGIILFVIGLILVPFYWVSAILIAVGAFVAFTCEACEIDSDRERIRSSILYFGIVKTGTWIQIKSFNGLRIVYTSRSYRTFSLSNRTTETIQKDYRVVLDSGTPQNRIEVMKSNSKEDAYGKARQLSADLNIDIIEP